jgi:hypothetical protein
MMMNYLRATLAGGIVWLLLIVTFTVLTYVPGAENSTELQAIVVIVLMVLYATSASYFYYKNGVENHGLKVGIWASGIALLLDILITVPFFEVPNGRGYAQFFATPLLWVLVIINIATFYVFGRRNIAALKERETH